MPDEPKENVEPSIYAKLRDLSRTPREGGGKFVDMNPSDLGPISVIPLPSEPELSKEQLRQLLLDSLDSLAKNPPPKPE